MKLFFKKINKSSKGFTLVETLVALSIFSVSLIGLMSVLAKGISDTGYVKEKDTAIYLAQEGIEYMRNMRDTFMLSDAGGPATGWTNFNTTLTGKSCFTIGAGCYFNPDNISGTLTLPMFACSSGSCSVMLYSSSTGRYGYTAGTSSVFTRRMNMTQVNANEIKVSSTVQGSGTKSVTLSENLFNWIE